MKTSINIPEWLHDEVERACPGIPFGTLARDALLIALPVWGELGPQQSVEQALRAQLRMMHANAAQAGVQLPPEAYPGRARRRPSTPATPRPAPPQAGLTGAARESATTGLGQPPPQIRQPHKPAPSRPNPKPIAGSSAAAKPSPAPAARTRRAAKTPAAT